MGELSMVDLARNGGGDGDAALDDSGTGRWRRRRHGCGRPRAHEGWLVPLLLVLLVACGSALIVVLVIFVPASSTASQSNGSEAADALPAPPLEAAVRGLYLWDEAPCLLPLPGTTPTAFAAACAAPDVAAYTASLVARLRSPWGGAFPAFTRIFLSITPAILVERPADVSAMLAELHRNSIAVEFLAGEPTWLLSDENAAMAVSVCATVAAFNQAAGSPSERFDAVHFDVEPHLLPGWQGVNTSRGTDDYNDDYEDRLVALLATCRATLNAAGARMAWDMTYWYYPSATDLWPRLLTPGVPPFVDYLCVLNYLGDPYEFLHGSNGTGDGGVLPLVGALQGHLPLVFAADVEEPPSVPAWITYWGVGTTGLEAALAFAVTGGRPFAGFAGVAVHYFVPYFALPPAGPILPVPTCVADLVNATVTVQFGGLSDVASVGLYGLATALGGLPPLIAAQTTSNGTAGGATAVVLAVPGLASLGPITARLFDGPGLSVLSNASFITSAACAALS